MATRSSQNCLGRLNSLDDDEVLLLFCIIYM